MTVQAAPSMETLGPPDDEKPVPVIWIGTPPDLGPPLMGGLSGQTTPETVGLLAIVNTGDDSVLVAPSMTTESVPDPAVSALEIN